MRIRLNLQNYDVIGDVNYDFNAILIDNIDNLNPDYNGLSDLRLHYEREDYYLTYKINQGEEITLKNDDILNISNNRRHIEFDCSVEDVVALKRLIDADILRITDSQISLFCFTQNCENHEVNKDIWNRITFVRTITGNFNHSIGVRNINIDIKDFFAVSSFNYVYIAQLKRFYYVDSIELMSADYTRLHLKEDVLMSWNTLIKLQKALVTRSEASTNERLVDERLPREDVITIEYADLVDTPSSESKKNITLITTGTNPHNILFSCLSWDSLLAQIESVYPPDIELPTITLPVHSPIEKRYLLSNVDLGLLQNAITKNFNAQVPIDIESYINSLIWLPFDLIQPYEADENIVGLSITLTNNTYLKITNNGEFGTGSTNSDQVYESWLCASPYFVLEDFTFNYDDSYLNNKPNAQWEIYIAFVGWVEVDFNQINNSRLVIYYTLDEKTGQGTANLYNMTSHKLIYSSNVQLGFKIDWSKTNADELSRQQQANVTNTILGLLTSAISVGVGIFTENPVAIAGGVLSAGKAIAGAVNANNMMFARAQTTFGGGDTNIHSPLNTAIRKSYHKEIEIDSDTYAHMQGYPCNKYYASLSSLWGYTEIGEIDFDLFNEKIYQDEVNDIIQLLKNGVRL